MQVYEALVVFLSGANTEAPQARLATAGGPLNSLLTAERVVLGVHKAAPPSSSARRSVAAHLQQFPADAATTAAPSNSAHHLGKLGGHTKANAISIRYDNYCDGCGDPASLLCVQCDHE